MTLIDDFLLEQEKYVKKYGEKTIVLMQVGSFFEVYAVDNTEEKNNNENLNNLADILNIQLIKK